MALLIVFSLQDLGQVDVEMCIVISVDMEIIVSQTAESGPFLSAITSIQKSHFRIIRMSKYVMHCFESFRRHNKARYHILLLCFP